MGYLGEALNVEHRAARVGDRLAKQCLGVRTEGGLDLFVGGFL